MKKEILGVFAVAALLAGCNSDSKSGPSSLSFDVSGHWEISEISGTEGVEPSHLMYVVVDPEGRFMGTQGDPEITVLGSDAGSIGLEGSGVSGSARYCHPISKTTNADPYPHECGGMSISLDIEDDNTLVGELVMTDPTNLEGETHNIKVERLAELNQPKDLDDLVGTWVSLNITDKLPYDDDKPQTATINIDEFGGFQYAYKALSLQGAITEVADNTYSVKNIEGESINVSGLAFVDAEGQLHMGVMATSGPDRVVLGDIYEEEDVE